MKYVFTLVGGHISPILVACERLGIQVVDTRHEVGETGPEIAHIGRERG